MEGTIEQLATALHMSRSPLFITGAGISVASGIAPFRGTDGAVWSNTVLEMGTHRMFKSDPARQWAWYLDRFDSCRGAQPNAAHRAIDRMQGWKMAEGVPLHVITQNIDGLHVAAGTPDVVEVHGAARKIRCSREGCVDGAPSGTLPWDDGLFAAFREDPKAENLPRCPRCGEFYRPHVLWFDERYDDHTGYRYRSAEDWFWNADLLVFVGTSFAVTITENAIIAAGMRGTPIWSVDPHSEPPQDAVTWLKAPSEEALPAVVTILETA